MSADHKIKINQNEYNDSILDLTKMFAHLHVTIAPLPIEIVDFKKDNQKSTKSEEDEPQQEL
jgi:hypothetical protein